MHEESRVSGNGADPLCISSFLKNRALCVRCKLVYAQQLRAN